MAEGRSSLTKTPWGGARRAPPQGFVSRGFALADRGLGRARGRRRRRLGAVQRLAVRLLGDDRLLGLVDHRLRRAEGGGGDRRLGLLDRLRRLGGVQRGLVLLDHLGLL